MLNYYNTGVTVELGDLIESGVDIWAFDYPVPRSVIEYNGKTCKVDFDKAELERKITDHYRFRQIGQETPGRWLHYFRTRMREIMPYYVQLYEFDAKFRNIEDPLESYNLREEFEQQTAGSGSITGTTEDSTSSETTGSIERSSSGSTEGTRDTETDFERRYSDTPQGSIDNLDDYLTEGTKEKTQIGETTAGSSSETGSESSAGTVMASGSGSSSQESTEEGSVSHTLTRRGNIGVQPLGGEVQNIRSAFINIDQMIINELKDLFLQMY